MTSAIPVFDAVKHFRADFLAYINGEKKPKVAKAYKDRVTAPCIDRCPAHIDIPTYIEEIKDRRHDESRITSYNVCYTKLLRIPADRRR